MCAKFYAFNKLWTIISPYLCTKKRETKNNEVNEIIFLSN